MAPSVFLTEAMSFPNSEQHLPLYGGGWVGVREPEYLGQPPPP